VLSKSFSAASINTLVVANRPMLSPSLKRMLINYWHSHPHSHPRRRGYRDPYYSHPHPHPHFHPQRMYGTGGSRIFWFVLGGMTVSIWHRCCAQSRLRDQHDCFRYSWRPPQLDAQKGPEFKLAAAGDGRMMEIAETSVDCLMTILAATKAKIQDRRLRARDLETEHPPEPPDTPQ